MNLSPTGRAAALLLFVLLFSCTSMVAARTPSSRTRLPAETTDLQRQLAEGARRLLGRRHLVVRGRTFPYDCTGTVLAIYWYAGIDLARDFGKYDGNGVLRLYRSLEKDNLLYSSPHPVTGDIIFWDNTYDRNGGRGLERHADPRGHGPALLAGRDHPVRAPELFAGHRDREHEPAGARPASKKLVRGTLRILNSPIRLKEPGQPHPPRWLAGQLYRVLGMGYLF